SFNDLAIRDAMEEDDAILNDDRAAESLADRPAPDHAWSRSAPYFSQGRSVIDAVAAGTEDLRPVRGDRLRSKHSREDHWSEKERSHQALLVVIVTGRPNPLARPLMRHTAQ